MFRAGDINPWLFYWYWELGHGALGGFLDYPLKGQVGTVVMEFDGNAFEVEFSHQDGTTYAMETIPATKLMLLHYELIGVVHR